MRIEEFHRQFGDSPRSIKETMLKWQIEEVAEQLHSLHDYRQHLVGSAVTVGDALHGDGMLDQIPSELRDAFRNLMHEKAASYTQMREILLSNLRSEDGSFLSFDHDRVRGLISKLKGQIGENVFKQQVGAAAELAHSGSQEAWDVAVKQADGAYQYFQVKLYGNPREVIRHMLKVQQKVAQGGIEGCTGDTVEHIDFAVPGNILDQVDELKQQYAELDSMQLLTIPIDSNAAADLVKEGMSNVGPDQLSHFFHELLGGAVAAGSLHVLANGFLFYKGAKEFSAAVAAAAAETAISTVGIGVGLLTETLCHTALISSGVGIGGRIMLRRIARSRWSFAEFLDSSISETRARISSLDPYIQPAGA